MSTDLAATPLNTSWGGCAVKEAQRGFPLTGAGGKVSGDIGTPQVSARQASLSCYVVITVMLNLFQHLSFQ